MKTQSATHTPFIDVDNLQENLGYTKSDAAFIVKAVNMHQLLVDDCRFSMEWFESNGYKSEAESIRKLLVKAEDK